MHHYFVFNSFWTTVSRQYISVWLHRQFITIIITFVGVILFELMTQRKTKVFIFSSETDLNGKTVSKLHQNCGFSNRDP